jgi:hypothetical protein
MNWKRRTGVALLASIVLLVSNFGGPSSTKASAQTPCGEFTGNQFWDDGACWMWITFYENGSCITYLGCREQQVPEDFCTCE